MANNYRYGGQRESVSFHFKYANKRWHVAASIKSLEPYCSEFLIHAADNEGLQKGIDEQLVERLAKWCSIPVTYAGGGRNLQDLNHVKTLSNGRVDLTIGSALDVFGGSGVTFEECVKWNENSKDWTKKFTYRTSIRYTMVSPIQHVTLPASRRHHSFGTFASHGWLDSIPSLSVYRTRRKATSLSSSLIPSVAAFWRLHSQIPSTVYPQLLQQRPKFTCVRSWSSQTASSTPQPSGVHHSSQPTKHQR